MGRTFQEVLDSPCVFCGFREVDGYWSSGTHSTACPWYYVEGREKRERFLRVLVDKMWHSLSAVERAWLVQDTASMAKHEEL